jgi:hypothetical protein
MPTLALILLCLTIGAAPLPNVAGRWVQSSVGQELVIRPKIKLTPYAAPGYGTNLGESVGYGSATTTVLATEAVPMQVTRRMTLAIASDGRFDWTVDKREAAPGCPRTVTQQRHGTATVEGGTLVLHIGGGRESFRKSCGGQGESALPATTERYAIQASAGQLVLSSGAVRWTFRRG